MHHTIYPVPVSVEYKSGMFLFGNKVLMKISSDFTNAGYIGKIKELWFNFCYEGSNLEIETDSSLPAHTFCIGCADIPVDVDELAYRMNISEEGVSIRGAGDKELLYGYYTLLQMIKIESLEEGKEGYYLDCTEVYDKPAIAKRFITFCVHPYTSLIMLRKQVRMAAMMKFTHIALEFWGSLKLDALKELSWKNGFTKDQIKPIIQDAIDMGMEVVPMFNHLGHASGSELLSCKHVVLDQNPRLATLFENSGWSFCVSNPETRKLLKKIRHELIELCGDGEYFNIGMDEAHDFGFCDRCSKYKPEELLADFVNEVNEDLKSVGRRPLMWGDMLLYKGDFKEYDVTENGKRHLLVANGSDKCPTHKAIELISKDVVIVDWQYYYLGKWPLLTAKYFKEKGFDVMSASWNDLDNVKLLCENVDTNKSFGYMSAVWQSTVNFPEIIIFSGEAAWLGENAKNIDSFRLELRFYDTANMQRRLLPRIDDYAEAGLMGEIATSTVFC